MSSTLIVFVLLAVLIGAGLALAVGYLYGRTQNKAFFEEQLLAEKATSEQKLLEVQAEQRSALHEAREETARFRSTIERENAERRAEVQRQERRLQQKEETFERKIDAFEQREHKLAARERGVEKAREEAEEIKSRHLRELERIAQLTEEQAKELLLSRIENQVRAEAAQRVRQIEERAREEADSRAREIITLAIQRCASDQVAEAVVSVVPLPNDEMKGRIIGREGRNIRALEAATGVDLIIDDTPEAIVISAFEPLRREVARMSLDRLIADGRIHPARIEEVVEKVRSELWEKIRQEGEATALEFSIPDLHPELIKLLGRLKYRTSYGQNVLQHSKEVSWLATNMAAELGADIEVAKRAGLLHDIGKAIDREMEGTHLELGREVLKKFGETGEVIHAMECHHGDYEPRSLEAVLVNGADALSAARPGARREILETYVKRLEKLEHIADGFKGVQKAFAIQAGRELRIVVEANRLSDDEALWLSRDVAKKIEAELQYPGQIKVTVIRETRAVEYAR